jgi:hypothetical protein
MQLIGQNNDGLDGKWLALAASLEHLPKVVNVFGQEFPAAFQQRDCEEERAAGNKGANILRHTLGRTQLLKAGCASLSRPTATEARLLLLPFPWHHLDKPPLRPHFKVSRRRGDGYICVV